MVIHEQGEGFVRMLKDQRLSLKTKGLLAYLSRCPEAVTINPEYVANDMHDGIASVRTAIAEAEKHGYLKREQKRIKTNAGYVFGEWVWTVRI